MTRVSPIPMRSPGGVFARTTALAVFVGLAVAVAASGCGGKNSSAAPAKMEITKEYKRGAVTFTVGIDRKEITVADRLHMELEVRAGEGYDVRMPEFGDKLEEFGIVDYNAFPAALAAGNVTVLRKSYVLEPFLSGDYKIPPMKVSYRKKGAKEDHELESEELTIKVRSMLPDKAAALTIQEIEPPVELPSRHAWLYWLSGAAILAACGAAGLAMRRKNQSAATPKRAAHEIAYDELLSLLAANLVDRGETKAFYTGLSDILRRYIENRFGLRAPERTTEEFLAELRDADALAASQKDLLKEFLRHCDLVKFAELQPTQAEIQKAFDACKRFIFETEEKPEPASSPDNEVGACP